MASDENIINEVKELRTDKEGFLNALTDISEKRKLEKLYEKLDGDFDKYGTGLLMSTALKPTYKDPYIAGGIGNAVGGLGLGVYSAIKTDQENERKRENYEISEKRAMEARARASEYRVKVLSDISEIKAFISSQPGIIAFQEERERAKEEELVDLYLKKTYSRNLKEVERGIQGLEGLSWLKHVNSSKALETAYENKRKIEAKTTTIKKSALVISGIIVLFLVVFFSIQGYKASLISRQLPGRRYIIPDREYDTFLEFYDENKGYLSTLDTEIYGYSVKPRLDGRFTLMTYGHYESAGVLGEGKHENNTKYIILEINEEYVPQRLKYAANDVIWVLDSD